MCPRHRRVVVTFDCPPDRYWPVILALVALTIAGAAAMAVASGRIA